MKISIILICILTCFSVKAQNSMLVKIEGNVIESYLKTSIKFPSITLLMDPDLKYTSQGDSLGNFKLECQISKKYHGALLLIKAEGHYMESRNEITFDTSKNNNFIKKQFEISPTCIDTWILPDILFQKNMTIYNKYTYFNDKNDSLLTDSVIYDWCKRFVKNPISKDFNIELISYSDYNEKKNISKKRLSFVYEKLLNAGIPRDNLVTTNRNREKRYYYKYRDGCHPYYLIKNQPLVIDIDLINKTTDPYEKELYISLRRVVTFNWKQRKN